MDHTRRNLLERALFGAGFAGLRALATGLPLAVFTRPLRAWAQDAPAMCADKARAQYLIVSTSGAGDPVNANVPGTYDFADIAHAEDPSMAKTAMKLGAQTVHAAAAWAALPPWVLERTAFFHHATLTNSHANHGKVLRLMGATARQEMLPSLFAQALAPCLGTVQREPISVGAGDVLTFEGRGLSNMRPTGLRDVLTRPTGVLAKLAQSRDKHLDRMYALVKQDGTKAQRQLVDRLALSRSQARSLSDDLVGMLAEVTSDRSDGGIVAAVVLVRMNVAPVVAIKLDFGGDNHTDAGLVREATETSTSTARIGQLMELLRLHGLQDRVTFALLNVFGRTLKKKGRNGRDHWGSHHASVLIGKGIKPGVIGGLEPQAGDYYATGIDSRTGRAVPRGGDVPFSETLPAMAKTLGRAVGAPAAGLDAQISGGKIVTGALAG